MLDKSEDREPHTDQLLGLHGFLTNLAVEYADQIGLTTSDDREAVAHIVKRGLTENLGDTPLLKPNSIAYTLRSLQLQNIIPKDDQELAAYLSNTITGIVDAKNIKYINESPLIGGSHAAGDAAILLNIESISAAAQELGMIPLTYRPSGDEFLPFYLCNNPIDIEKLIAKANEYKDKAITAIANDNTHPLHRIACENPDLIGRSLSLCHLKDVNLPPQVQRADDISEVILAQAERNSNEQGSVGDAGDLPSIQKAALKKFLSTPPFPERIFPLQPDGTTTAITAIVNATRETTTITPDEKDPTTIAARWQLIDTYCPPSLKRDIDSLKRSSGNDLDKQALSLKIIEEAIFNFQYQRTPPILNRSVYHELITTTRNQESFQYQEVGMISTFFLKLVNMTDGRLGGDRVIRNMIEAASKAIPPQADGLPSLILTKDGGSLYFAGTNEAINILTAKLTEQEDALIHALQDRLVDNSQVNTANISEVVRQWTQIPVFTRRRIDQSQDGTRTLEYIGRQFDELRDQHYLNETGLIDYLITEMNRSVIGHTDLVKLIFKAAWLERASRRSNDLQHLWR